MLGGTISAFAMKLSKILPAAVFALQFSSIIPAWAAFPRPSKGQQGMVAAAHPLATQVGLQILQRGGNAVDAAVATTLAISVVEPFSAGIGGGGFLLVQTKDGMQSLDFRERAPQAASRNMYLDANGKVKPKASLEGHLSAGIPGTIAGLAAAHRRYGKLPWAELVQPAIEIANNGFTVTNCGAKQICCKKIRLLAKSFYLAAKR
jgi:gamma-glutamyltranspeptidase / glutathione hydrolase